MSAKPLIVAKPNRNGVPQFNLNSILTLVVCAVVTFVWNSVVKLNESVVRMQSAQEATQRTLNELMPKPEIMLRFGVVEKDLLDLRLRVQAVEIELGKLRK